MSGKRSESLDEMTLSFLACRDKGHHWQHLDDSITVDGRKRVREVTRRWECKGCTTEVVETLQIPSCDIKSRRYVYPDGYLLIAGAIEGRQLRVSDVRREVLGRSGIHF